MDYETDGSQQEPLPAPRTPASEKRILIADDDPQILEFLSNIVKKEGFQIETASDGEEALDKAERLPPHLIILDLKMPKMDGMEMIRRLQAGDCAKVPVLVVTGHMVDRDSQAMIKQEPNVKGAYTKPFNAVMLAMDLHSLLKTRPLMGKATPGW